MILILSSDSKKVSLASINMTDFKRDLIKSENGATKITISES